MEHERPTQLWKTLETDLFTWNKETYLIVVTYYSKDPIVQTVASII